MIILINKRIDVLAANEFKSFRPLSILRVLLNLNTCKEDYRDRMLITFFHPSSPSGELQLQV